MITDFDGNLMREFDYRDELGLLSVNDVSAITTWPNGGIFGAVSSESSEIVVFVLR